jgi:uncharacterized C2H2 Zn-finger protein
VKTSGLDSVAHVCSHLCDGVVPIAYPWQSVRIPRVDLQKKKKKPNTHTTHVNKAHEKNKKETRTHLREGKKLKKNNNRETPNHTK